MEDDTVLVGILKQPRDLEILLDQEWYRIPLAFAPKRPFSYVAFYQPASFGRRGKRIEYFGPVKMTTVAKRIDLLPDEPDHPGALHAYLKVSFEQIVRLPHPILNIIPRRVSFGFTTLERLLNAHELLKLYGVPPTEQMVAASLGQRGIPSKPEQTISAGRRRYRVDLAIVCRDGSIAIECDNRQAHLSPDQRTKDRSKDAWLRRHGWRVIRLKEDAILHHLDRCVERIEGTITALGGLGQRRRA